MGLIKTHEWVEDPGDHNKYVDGKIYALVRLHICPHCGMKRIIQKYKYGLSSQDITVYEDSLGIVQKTPGRCYKPG